MPQRDPGVYLEDIEHYADAAVRFVRGYTLEQYLADEKTRAAVERVLEICGEAMNGLYKVSPAIADKIPQSLLCYRLQEHIGARLRRDRSQQGL